MSQDEEDLVEQEDTFLDELANWLKDKKETPSVVRKTVACLKACGATSRKELQNISDNKKEFRETLSAKGVIKVICDLLFEKYVARETKKCPKSNDFDDFDPNTLCEKVFNNVEIKTLELPEFQYPEAFPRRIDGDGITLRACPSNEERPNMLLAGLEGSEPKYLIGGAIKKDLEKSIESVACALFAVSGQGKTRLICELLTHRFGFLFTVLDKNSQNFGSLDITSAVDNLTTGINNRARRGFNGLHCDSFVRHHIACLLLARVLVLEKLFSLIENLTPYQWLLAQMYPVTYFNGNDVFLNLYKLILENSNCEGTDLESFKSVLNFFNIAVDNIRKKHHLSSSGLLVFIDEAQLIRGLCKDRFDSRSCGPQSQDFFFGFVQAFAQCGAASVGHLTYPTFCGTGFSMTPLLDSIGHASSGQPDIQSMFCDFEWENNHKTFIEFVSNTNEIDEDILVHAKNWLKGRARWSASFVSFWLETARRFGREVALGNGINRDNLVFQLLKDSDTLSGYSLVLHFAIGEFVKEYVRKREDINDLSPEKFLPGGSLALCEKQRKDLVPVVKLLSVFYACIGKSVFVASAVIKAKFHMYDTTELVERGMCLLTRHSTKVMMAEPLIVQACLERYDWGVLVETFLPLVRATASAIGVGRACERAVIPLIQALFQKEKSLGDIEELLHQTNKLNPLKDLPNKYNGHWRLGRSMCGVMVRQVDTKELVKWAGSTRTARFDGQFIPVVRPPTTCGPTSIFMVRDDIKLERKKWVLLQLKTGRHVNATNALLTVNPELLFHDKRNKIPRARVEFEELYSSMFGSPVREEGVFRVLCEIHPESKNPQNKNTKEIVTKFPVQGDNSTVKKSVKRKVTDMQLHITYPRLEKLIKTVF